jgi:hypothetical protein
MKLTNSPWGPVQHQTKLADGIWSVTTAGHGGIKLNDERQGLMPEHWRQTPYSKAGWYEEDCDWCLPFIIFEADILAGGDEDALRMIRMGRHIEIFRDWHPDKFEERYHTTLKPGQSYRRDHPFTV